MTCNKVTSTCNIQQQMQERLIKPNVSIHVLSLSPHCYCCSHISLIQFYSAAFRAFARAKFSIMSLKSRLHSSSCSMLINANMFSLACPNADCSSPLTRPNFKKLLSPDAFDTIMRTDKCAVQCRRWEMSGKNLAMIIACTWKVQPICFQPSASLHFQCA